MQPNAAINGDQQRNSKGDSSDDDKTTEDDDMELQLSAKETNKVKTVNYPMKEKNDIKFPKSAHAHMKDYVKHMGVSFTIIHSKYTSSGTTRQGDFKSKSKAAAANDPLHTSETSDKVQKCDNTSTNNP